MQDTERQRTPPQAMVGRNVVVWGVIGAAVGLVLGTLIGLAYTTPGRFGFWMALVGSTIFVSAVFAFTAGIASLDSPPPGDEPPDETPAEDR